MLRACIHSPQSMSGLQVGDYDESDIRNASTLCVPNKSIVVKLEPPKSVFYKMITIKRTYLNVSSFFIVTYYRATFKSCKYLDVITNE